MVGHRISEDDMILVGVGKSIPLITDKICHLINFPSGQSLKASPLWPVLLGVELGSVYHILKKLPFAIGARWSFEDPATTEGAMN